MMDEADTDCWVENKETTLSTTGSLCTSIMDKDNLRQMRFIISNLQFEYSSNAKRGIVPKSTYY